MPSFLSSPEFWWKALGFGGQAAFASRFLVQWIVSEKQQKSVIPVFFWYLSLCGGTILLIYAIHIRDPVFIAGQSGGLLIYIRNLMLIHQDRRRAGARVSLVESGKSTTS